MRGTPSRAHFHATATLRASAPASWVRNGYVFDLWPISTRVSIPRHYSAPERPRRGRACLPGWQCMPPIELRM
eukprot:3792497-Pleurochrysis_carterae.AAC.1